VGRSEPESTKPVKSQPHHIAVDPAGQFLIVRDKGQDRVFSFRLDASTGKLVPGEPPSANARPGAAHIPGRVAGTIARGPYPIVRPREIAFCTNDASIILLASKLQASASLLQRMSTVFLKSSTFGRGGTTVTFGWE
jgi:Lactonase, 7-bladed beta-propeller